MASRNREFDSRWVHTEILGVENIHKFTLWGEAGWRTRFPNRAEAEHSEDEAAMPSGNSFDSRWVHHSKI